MSALPSISVVIPALRCNHLLRQAFDSVLLQDYQPLDIWLVDNGASDELRQLAAYYNDRVPVQYRQEPQRGAAHARNRAIRESAGELLAFLDDDDLWTPGHLHRLTQLLIADPGLGIAQGHSRNFKQREDGRLVYCSPIYQFTAIASSVYRRSVFQTVGLFDGSLAFGEDTDFWIRCWENGIRKQVVDPISLLYRRHDGNMTANKNLQELGIVQVFKRRLDRKRQGLPGTEKDSQEGLKEYLGTPLNVYDDGRYEEHGEV